MKRAILTMIFLTWAAIAWAGPSAPPFNITPHNTDATAHADLISGLPGGHDAVTLSADFAALFGLTGQELTVDSVTANYVLAGPTSGAAADPAFRPLVADDIPDLSGTYLTAESDSVVGAVTGIVKADGAGSISAASAGTDYLAPDGDGSALSGVVTTESDPTALLTAGTDNVKDTHVDWGSGAGQVDIADIPGGTAPANAFDFASATWRLPTADAGPTATAGYIVHDTAVTNHANGAVRYHDGTNIRQVVDMVAATAEGCTDDQVVAYDADADLFYCKADASGAGAFTAGATSVIAPTAPIVLDEATGNEYGFSLFYQTNKATSGDDTGQIISQRDTASPGTSYLARWGTNTDGTVGTHTDNFTMTPGTNAAFSIMGGATGYPTLSFKQSTNERGRINYHHADSGMLFQLAAKWIFANHLHTTGTDPAVSTCGTSPSIVGADNAGIVTVGGGGAVTACTVTFAGTYGTEPACVVTPQANVTAYISASSATAITVTFSGDIQSGKFNYSCMGL